MGSSFIKIDRKILNWEWWDDINTSRLFIYMLIAAYWKEGNYKGKVIERGSFPSSIAELSKQTNLTEMEIRTALKHLQLTGEVTSKSTNKFTVFTIKNYNLYQSDNKQNNEQVTSKITNEQQTINKPLTSSSIEENDRIKEVKNVKKVNNAFKLPKVVFPEDEKMNEAFMEFAEMRARIKKPISTEKTFKRLLSTLEKLSNGDNNLAIEILNQSTDCCYQGLFEIKQDHRGNRNSNEVTMKDWMNGWGLESDGE